MQRLPKQLTLEQLQSKWPAIIDPILSSPITNGLLLNNIPLISGSNVINHKLGRKLQGWIIVGINDIASIYDTQASNQMPELTLSLTSNAPFSTNNWFRA